MYLLRPDRPKIKPRQWGPISAVRGAVRDWFERHGMHVPVLYPPLWEGAGNAIHDLSGHNLVGVGNGTWTPAGYQLTDSSSQKVTLGKVWRRIAGSTQATVLARIFPTYLSADSNVIRSNNGNYDFLMLQFSSDYDIRFYFRNAAGVQTSSDNTAPLNEVSEVVGRYNDGEIDAFVNGAKGSSRSRTAGALVNTYDADLTLGDDYDATCEYLKLMIFDVALSDDQIALLHDQPYAALQPRSIPFYSIPASAGTTEVPIMMNHYRRLRAV